MKRINMEMKNVEIICALAHHVHHQRVMRNDIGGKVVQSKSATTTGNETGRGDRVRTCKQRNVVAQAHELFSQISNDPLGTTIQARRNAFDERCNLRNFHEAVSPSISANALSSSGRFSANPFKLPSL